MSKVNFQSLAEEKRSENLWKEITMALFGPVMWI